MSKKMPSKKPLGRPVSVGGTAFVGVRLSADLTQRVDAWANSEGVGRSEALRQLLELGLKAKSRK